MQAIILAAGKSTRMHPLTVEKPKSLLNIANKTILEHNLEQLNGLADEVLIIVGFRKEMIMEKIGAKFKNIKIRYIIQKEQLGTGDALLQAEMFLKDRFIALGGDDLFSRQDIKNCLKYRHCILAEKVNNPEKFGVLVLDKGIVKKIVEKPKKYVSDLANTGLYVLDKKIFDILKKIKKSERNEYELTDALQILCKTEKVHCVDVKDYWLPIGYPWHILEANEFFLKRIKKSEIKGKIEKNVFVKNNVAIGKNTIVKSGCYIEGPAVIGENCEIGPNCYIRAYTSIGNNCKIGNGVEIKNSVVMDNTKIPHLSYVGDSVIGEHTNLGAGTKIANLRHDKQTIKTMINGELVDTGRRKFGAAIGDNVHTGINTTIYPGRKIWPNRTTKPGEVVEKDII